MAPRRRVRRESLVVRGRNEGDKTLFETTTHDFFDTVPTQRLYQVNSDARALAYSGRSDGSLQLLRRDGKETRIEGAGNQDFRFAPDGSWLALGRRVEGGWRMERIDVKSFESRVLGAIEEPIWIEFCNDGLIVLHNEASSGKRALSLLPWEREPRRLAEVGWSARFSAAKRGSRIAFFQSNEIFELYPARPEPRSIAKLDAWIQNAEMSPDGRSLALANDQGLWILEGEAEARLVPSSQDTHSVWFSPDGSALAWASPERAEWQKGTLHRVLNAGSGSIEAMRFVQGAMGLCVVRGNELLLWFPEEDRVEHLYRVEDDRRLIGADLFAGGMVLWLATPWKEDELLPRKLG